MLMELLYTLITLQKYMWYTKGGKYEEEFQEGTGYGDRDDNGYFIGCVFPKDCP